MTKQTEKHEQEFIDAWIEEERQPRKDVPEVVGRIILENTDEYNRAFGWTDMGEYLERE